MSEHAFRTDVLFVWNTKLRINGSEDTGDVTELNAVFAIETQHAWNGTVL
jgi:hypothetical protein